MFIDTHAHFDDSRFDEDRENALLNAHREGADIIINVGADLDSSKRSVELAEKYDFVYATVGIHPEFAEKVANSHYFVFDTLCSLAQNKRVVAVGEAGLDYHYEPETKNDQKFLFEKNIELSRLVKKPLVVHDRDAHEDVLNIMEAQHIGPGEAVIHCFSGSGEMAKTIARKGWYFSVGGVVTFKNAKKVVEAIPEIPDELLMLETDCPYMAPEPFRGTRNDSSLIKYTARRIADIKNISVERLYEITKANSIRFFGIMDKKQEEFCCN